MNLVYYKEAFFHLIAICSNQIYNYIAFHIALFARLVVFCSQKKNLFTLLTFLNQKKNRIDG